MEVVWIGLIKIIGVDVGYMKIYLMLESVGYYRFVKFVFWFLMCVFCLKYRYIFEIVLR